MGKNLGNMISNLILQKQRNEKGT